MRLTSESGVAQRRHWSRADIVLNTRLTAKGDRGEAIATTTSDVSPGGVQVHWPAGAPTADRYDLTLDGGGLAAPVAAEAVRTRTPPGGLCLRFSEIDPADRRRLTDVVLLVLNERAAGSRGA